MIDALERARRGARAAEEDAIVSKRVLVTGGSGFLGSLLCERLLQEGAEVLCADNFLTGSKDNVAHLMDDHRFEMIRHDVTLPLHVEVDEIYNLATPGAPARYQFDPVLTTKTNVLGAINVLGLAKRLRARVLQASSSEVYGDPEVHPQREDYWGNVNPLGLRACYEVGKRCAETLFFDYHRQHGVAVKVARIFNAYGPRMGVHDGRVVPTFIVQALLGLPLTVYGNGEQTRSFCFADDVIDGMVRLMAMPAPFTGPVNLGDPTEVTVRELAELILELTGSSSPLTFRPLPENDPRRRRPDIALARHALDWEPKVALREGLSRTIASVADAIERERQRAQPGLASATFELGP